MKRSRHVQLVLLGALSGCGPLGKLPPTISTDAVYTNNFHVPGAGYYHAPFRAWYALPYNHYDAGKKQYYYGGQWGAAPHQSITNISAPTASAVQLVAATRTDVTRGGFGSSSRSRSVWS